MVESYQKIISPAPGTIENLVKETSDPSTKWKTLAEARNRAEWERGKRKREDERKKEKDEEQEAMGLIDWQDFVLVETIEFTQQDMELELPPPTNVERLKTMSMAEKRMASMVMEEVGGGASGPGAGIGANGLGASAGAGAVDAEEVEMEEDDEGEEVRLQRIKAEQEQARARDVQRAAMQSRGVKIKTDYTPKGESTRAASAAFPMSFIPRFTRLALS
jgi:splicing factor 3A subunit 1